MLKCICTQKQKKRTQTMSKFLSGRKPTNDTRAEQAAQSVKDTVPKRLSLDLTQEMHTQLKQLAASQGVSMKQLVMQALEKTVIGARDV
jgi:predicted HicB family RNase H-like nuclease